MHKHTCVSYNDILEQVPAGVAHKFHVLSAQEAGENQETARCAKAKSEAVLTRKTLQSYCRAWCGSAALKMRSLSPSPLAIQCIN